MLSNEAIDVIEQAGIKAPPTLQAHRTTCPMCSETRRKKNERCLVVTEHDWGVEWYCHHCKYTDSAIL